MQRVKGRHERHESSGVVAGVIGNVMEWYDFALFGYLVSYISGDFFPPGNEFAALLATWGIFAAGFVMRPLGGGLFGWIGDRVGRCTVLVLSVVLMALPTLGLGVLPTYAGIGIAAPLLLVLIRLIQGLSVGGEFSGSVTYMVETAPRDRRGISGSWANVGSMVGMLLGSGMATGVTNLLPEAMVREWGWRIPFILGGILGLFAFFEVRKLHRDHCEQREKKHLSRSPLKEALTKDMGKTLTAIAYTAGYGVIFYIPLVYLPNYVHEHIGMDLGLSMQINTIGTFLLLFFIPLFGRLSDTLMRRKTILSLAFAFLVLGSYPLFLLLQQGGYLLILFVQLVFALAIAVPLGVSPALLVELYPAEDRLTGYSLAYNIGLGVVGGTTPMMSAWLINATGSTLAPALYLAGLSVVSLAGVLLMRDRSREELQ